jgi:TRAP-type C4-dicarboxylate transport system substrate-binding protein
MSFSELYSALQTGVVEAQENPLPTIVAAGFAEVRDYLSLTGHFYNTVMFVINTDVWNKISEEDQAIILAAAKDMEKEVRVNNDASTEANIQALKDAGMQVNDDVDKEAFREAMLPVYDKWEKDVFGTELMDVYRSCSGW